MPKKKASKRQAPRSERVKKAVEIIRNHPEWGRARINAELQKTYSEGLKKDFVTSLRYAELGKKPTRGWSGQYAVRVGEQVKYHRTYKNTRLPALAKRSDWFWAKSGHSKLFGGGELYRHFHKHYGFIPVTYGTLQALLTDANTFLTQLQRRFTGRHIVSVETTLIPRAKNRAEAIRKYYKNPNVNAVTFISNSGEFLVKAALLDDLRSKLMIFTESDYAAYLVMSVVRVYES